MNQQLIKFLTHTLESYHTWTGRHWPSKGASGSDEWIQSILTSPSVLVCHDTSEDPIFKFGNQIALDLFEMDFETFTTLPSRKSAEPMLREERDHLIQSVRKNGYTDSYQGIRISSTGKRFHIPQATVWNVVDENQNYLGQAATFSEWKFLQQSFN
jgi:hypothetical protein